LHDAQIAKMMQRNVTADVTDCVCGAAQVLYSKFGFMYTELKMGDEEFILIREDDVIGERGLEVVLQVEMQALRTAHEGGLHMMSASRVRILDQLGVLTTYVVVTCKLHILGVAKMRHCNVLLCVPPPGLVCRHAAAQQCTC
jgi:hypothetical protein